MSQSDLPSPKRVVSRVEYFSRQLLMWLLQCGVYLTGILIGCLFLWIIVADFVESKQIREMIAQGVVDPQEELFWHNPAGLWGDPVMAFVATILGVPLLLIGCLVSWKLMHRSRRTLQKIQPALPISVSNIPDAEVLVRSSQEPKLDYGSVLLRPAKDGSEVRSEELLRAVQSEKSG